ncbi:MAG: hypothetical protein LC737_05900, partial [Chloroflexi bacterium]|nr:hypothetical protein [Chloroflexota bacterium]
PTRLGIITYTVYVPLKILAFVNFGVLGLAATTSLFVIANFIGQMFFLERATAVQAQRAPVGFGGELA